MQGIISSQENQYVYSSIIRVFDGVNYLFGIFTMEAYIISLGVDVCATIEYGYKVPTTQLTYLDERRAEENNVKAMNVMIAGLNQSELIKVMHWKSTKQAWDKLKNFYEGYEKVK